MVFNGFYKLDSINGSAPIAGWFIRENPNLKWMKTRRTPIYGTPTWGNLEIL